MDATACLATQILCMGLLLHESVYFASRGRAYVTTNVAPVFGLHIGPKLRLAIHTLHFVALLLLISAPSSAILASVVFCTLSLIVASFSARLPNHLALAWMMMLALLTDHLLLEGGDLFRLMNCVNLFILYAASGFHKLRRSYLSPVRSCGVMVVLHYFAQRGIVLRDACRQIVYFFAVPVVIGAELCGPLLLTWSDQAWVLLCFVLMHVAFGFLAHVHFSTICFACLLSFLDPTSVASWSFPRVEWVGIGAALGITLGIGLGNHRAYLYRPLSMLNHAVFGCIVCFTFYCITSTQRGSFPPSGVLENSISTAISIFLTLLAFFNAASPYVGLKFDFSYAMFSNMRPDYWDHIIIRRPICRITHPKYFALGLVNKEAFGEKVLGRFFPSWNDSIFHENYIKDSLSVMKQEGISVEKFAFFTPFGRPVALSNFTESGTFGSRLNVASYQLPKSFICPHCI